MYAQYINFVEEFNQQNRHQSAKKIKAPMKNHRKIIKQSQLNTLNQSDLHIDLQQTELDFKTIGPTQDSDRVVDIQPKISQILSLSTIKVSKQSHKITNTQISTKPKQKYIENLGLIEAPIIIQPERIEMSVSTILELQKQRKLEI